MRIEQLDELTHEDVDSLADLLLDAVDSGAGVSFMPGLTRADARDWWQKVVDRSAPRPTILLVARDDQGIAGSVQIQPSWAPNQPHRGDVAKMIVHRRARRQGIARELMLAVETHARAERLSLLVLDTCKDGAAERLYTSLEWVRVGEIPNFALNPDGSWCDTVFFFKQLA